MFRAGLVLDYYTVSSKHFANSMNLVSLHRCLCSRLISAGLNRFKFCAIDKDSAILITPKSLACIIAILAEQIKEAHLFPMARSHNHGTMLEIY